MAVATPAASGTKSLFVMDCIGKLTALSGSKPGNQNVGTWAWRHSVERGYRQTSKRRELGPDCQSRALPTTIPEQI